MKIAYLSTFYPYRGGIAQFNAALFRQFESEHEIKAYTFTRQYPNILFPGTSQLVTSEDSADKVDAMRTLDTINPFTYCSTAKKIGKFKPDVMLMKFWMPFFAPSLGTVAKKISKTGCKSIAILDNVIPHERRPGDIALTKYFLNNVDGFVTMSSVVERDLLQLKPNAKYVSLPHPLYSHFGAKLNKTEARKSLSLPDNAKVILFFGFIRSYKGLDILIETLAELPEDYYLLIAGEPYGSFDIYYELISKHKLEHRVSKHVRYISDNETPMFFSAADVCVLPYKSATQSGIVGIAYHFDLPVIATDKGGLREMIVPWKTGIVVDDAASSLLSAAIWDYFNSDYTEKYGKNILNYKKAASWENMGNSIVNFYETL